MPLRVVLGFFVGTGLLLLAAALMACTSISTVVAWEGCDWLIDRALGLVRSLEGLFGD
jgi:ABC-type nickel/cobalt efflux system permease component RcnA